MGVVNHKTVTSLDMTNDPVIFAEHFRTGFAGRPSWTLPADQPGLGDQPPMPVKDERTFVRVAVLLRLLPDHCLTKKANEQNAVVTVPTIDQARPSDAQLPSQPQTYSAFSFKRSPNPANRKAPRSQCANNYTYSLGRAGCPPPTALSCTRELPTFNPTNLIPWRRRIIGDVPQAISSRTTVKGLSALSTNPTLTPSTPSSTTFASPSGKTSTGRHSMKANY